MSYITVDYLQTYADSINFDLSGYSDREVPASVVVASDYLDAHYEFKTPIVEPVPAAIQKACAMAAILHLQGLLLIDYAGLANGAIKRDKSGVGPLASEVEYFESTVPATKRPTPLIDGLLKPYLVDANGIQVFSAGRRC